MVDIGAEGKRNSWSRRRAAKNPLEKTQGRKDGHRAQVGGPVVVLQRPRVGGKRDSPIRSHEHKEGGMRERRRQEEKQGGERRGRNLDHHKRKFRRRGENLRGGEGRLWIGIHEKTKTNSFLRGQIINRVLWLRGGLEGGGGRKLGQKNLPNTPLARNSRRGESTL